MLTMMVKQKRLSKIHVPKEEGENRLLAMAKVRDKAGATYIIFTDKRGNFKTFFYFCVGFLSRHFDRTLCNLDVVATDEGGQARPPGQCQIS